VPGRGALSQDKHWLSSFASVPPESGYRGRAVAEGQPSAVDAQPRRLRAGWIPEPVRDRGNPSSISALPAAGLSLSVIAQLVSRHFGSRRAEGVWAAQCLLLYVDYRLADKREPAMFSQLPRQQTDDDLRREGLANPADYPDQDAMQGS